MFCYAGYLSVEQQCFVICTYESFIDFYSCIIKIAFVIHTIVVVIVVSFSFCICEILN